MKNTLKPTLFLSLFLLFGLIFQAQASCLNQNPISTKAMADIKELKIAPIKAIAFFNSNDIAETGSTFDNAAIHWVKARHCYEKQIKIGEMINSTLTSRTGYLEGSEENIINEILFW